MALIRKRTLDELAAAWHPGIVDFDFCTDPTCSHRDRATRAAERDGSSTSLVERHYVAHVDAAIAAEYGRGVLDHPAGKRTEEQPTSSRTAADRRRIIEAIKTRNPHLVALERDRDFVRANIALKARRPGNDVAALTDDEARDAALHLLDDRTVTRTFRSQRTGDDLDRSFREDSHIARLAIVTENADYRSALMRLLTTRPDQHPTLKPAERDALLRVQEYRAQSEGTDASGGFAIQPSIDPSVTVSDYGATNFFERICRVENISLSDEWRGITSPGKSWAFKGEAASATDASMTSISQPTIPVYSAMGFVDYSIEIGEDWPNFAQNISAALAAGYSELLVNKLTTGSGTNEPTGILTALAAASPVVLITSATDGAFGDVDVLATWAALPAKWKERAVWMADSTVANQIRLNSSLYHASSVGIDGTIVSNEVLVNHQFIENPYMPAWSSTTSASTRLIVGDWSTFVLVKRAGMAVEPVTTMIGTAANRPVGRRALLAYARIGSDVTAAGQGFRYQANTA